MTSQEKGPSHVARGGPLESDPHQRGDDGFDNISRHPVTQCSPVIWNGRLYGKVTEIGDAFLAITCRGKALGRFNDPMAAYNAVVLHEARHAPPEAL